MPEDRYLKKLFSQDWNIRHIEVDRGRFGLEIIGINAPRHKCPNILTDITSIPYML